jgi:hypothetical protein
VVDNDIKLLLGKMAETLALVCDETSELVDKYHRPFVSESGLVAIRDRSLALSVAADNMRQASKTILGTEGQQAAPREGFQTKVAK